MATRRRQKTTITDSLGRERSATRAGWGKIRALPSGKLQASYADPNGRVNEKGNPIRYTAPMTFVAKADAEGWLAGVRADIARGIWKSPDTLAAEAAEAEKRASAERFATYAATWVDQRVSSKGKPLRPKTATEYRRQLAKGLAAFADDRLTAITPARVRAWHADRMKAGPTAAGAEARLLRAILNTAVADGVIETNPVVGALTRTSAGVEHRPPTLEELGVMLDTIDPRFRLAILLAAYGNIRLSEWRALRRRDVAIVDGRALVNVTRQAQHITGRGWVVGEPKSAEGKRVVPLPTTLTADVEAHLAEHVGAFPDALLFAPVGRSEFIHDAQFNDRWNVARDAAGVRVALLDGNGEPTGHHKAVVREHDLRAFALTAFAQAGGTMRETQAFGGHATIDAAMRYQHAAADRLAEIVDRMPVPTPGTRTKVTKLP